MKLLYCYESNLLTGLSIDQIKKFEILKTKNFFLGISHFLIETIPYYI